MDKLNKTPQGRAMKAQYDTNKAAKLRATIKCPVCGEAFSKKTVAQAICCIQCKDAYHNARKPNRHKDGRMYYRDYDANRRESSYYGKNGYVFLTEEDLIQASAAYGEDDY